MRNKFQVLIFASMSLMPIGWVRAQSTTYSLHRGNLRGTVTVSRQHLRFDLPLENGARRKVRFDRVQSRDKKNHRYYVRTTSSNQSDPVLWPKVPKRDGKYGVWYPIERRFKDSRWIIGHKLAPRFDVRLKRPGQPPLNRTITVSSTELKVTGSRTGAETYYRNRDKERDRDEYRHYKSRTGYAIKWPVNWQKGHQAKFKMSNGAWKDIEIINRRR